jgi:hypothetical protein
MATQKTWPWRPSTAQGHHTVENTQFKQGYKLNPGRRATCFARAAQEIREERAERIRLGLEPDYDAIRGAVLPYVKPLLRRLLPGGAYKGDEYIVLNPRRCDRTPGSFTINWRAGSWADFAARTAGGEPVKGGDLISLVAYLMDKNQHDAARLLEQWLRASGAPL